MSEAFERGLQVTRRFFLGRGAGLSLGALALASLNATRVAAAGGDDLSREPAPGLPGLPHFRPRARRVIFLTQSGGPSQLELFDEKPGLLKWAGQELPESVRQGQRVTTMTSNQKQLVMPTRVKFVRQGRSGTAVGEWLPHLARVVDDLCVIKSMRTDQINHAPAMTQFLTGHQIPGRPSVGGWLSYVNLGGGVFYIL